MVTLDFMILLYLKIGKLTAIVIMPFFFEHCICLLCLLYIGGVELNVLNAFLALNFLADFYILMIGTLLVKYFCVCGNILLEIFVR